jgi:leader peptidase (prepilin peptidase)/N-methyltransferase
LFAAENMSAPIVIPARTGTARAVPAAFHPIAVVVPLAMAALVARAAPSVWASIAAITVAALAADVDRRTRRIPNRHLAGASLPLVALAVASLASGSTAPLRSMVAGSFLMALPVLVLHLVAPGGMGFGDVKAAALLGAAVGVVEPSLGLLALAIGTGLTVAWAAVRRHSIVPFGPGLVIGAVVAVGSALVIGLEASP